MPFISQKKRVEERICSVSVVANSVDVAMYAERDGKPDMIGRALTVKQAKKLRKELGRAIKVASLAENHASF
ncbi:MAG: hypothetical protein ACK5LO_02505 [Leucobacter sp.]